MNYQGAKELWTALKIDSVILINLCCFKDERPNALRSSE